MFNLTALPLASLGLVKITATKINYNNHKHTCSSWAHGCLWEDGGQTKDPHGQRKTQQKHHAKRKRSQDAEATGGEVSRWALAPRTLRICCVWLSHISDHPEHSYGHVTAPRRAPQRAPHRTRDYKSIQTQDASVIGFCCTP